MGTVSFYGCFMLQTNWVLECWIVSSVGFWLSECFRNPLKKKRPFWSLFPLPAVIGEGCWLWPPCWMWLFPFIWIYMTLHIVITKMPRSSSPWLTVYEFRAVKVQRCGQPTLCKNQFVWSVVWFTIHRLAASECAGPVLLILSVLTMSSSTSSGSCFKLGLASDSSRNPVMPEAISGLVNLSMYKSRQDAKKHWYMWVT